MWKEEDATVTDRTPLSLRIDMLRACVVTRISIIGVVGLLSACAFIPQLVKTPSIEIYTVSSPRVNILSARLWRTDSRITLEGKVRGKPGSKRSISGHIEVVIISPEGKPMACLMTRAKQNFRSFRERYFVELEHMPSTDSRIVISYQDTPMPSSCTTCSASDH